MSHGNKKIRVPYFPLPMTDPWDERYNYLHEWLIFTAMVHVGKCTIHGSYGLYWLFHRYPYNGL